MRRLTLSKIPVLILVGALVWGPAACRRKEKVRVEATDETAPTIASQVNVADPKAAPQLLKGFHDPEQNAWRWTKGKFSVTLRPPANAAAKGAALVVKFSIPEVLIQRLHAMTLSANVNGAAMAGETYTKPGDQVYLKDVPASALARDAVTVEFSLDKYLAPGALDQRELGIVVSSIGLEAK
ncbi:MAG TPA: hypothetical protein VMZ52_07780 [Bryobacteraceae bacterium]|nr:hypothetical protein [Bryobacteraceae bacterium]